VSQVLGGSWQVSFVNPARVTGSVPGCGLLLWQVVGCVRAYIHFFTGRDFGQELAHLQENVWDVGLLGTAKLGVFCFVW
jgi:hypothetical protein